MTSSELTSARPDDIEEIDSFLTPLTASSMFLRSNIRAYGVTGGESAFATRIWLARDGGRLVGVLGRTTRGMVLTQMPEAGPASMRRAAETLSGRPVIGLSGDADQVRALRAAAGLEGGASLDKDEWLYDLELADLVVPPGGGVIRKARPDETGLLEHWRAAYNVEAIGADSAEAQAMAQREVEAMLASGACRILERNGRPAGMTSLNAALPDCVQVGGVYTSPDQRGSGVARRLVAGHLAELRAEGVRRAVLFASDPAARRAYEAIGFRRCGTYGLALFPAPRPVAPRGG